jgi:hypothetical protein
MWMSSLNMSEHRGYSIPRDDIQDSKLLTHIYCSTYSRKEILPVRAQDESMYDSMHRTRNG